MRIGFGAPVAGAWATPGNLTAFARRAEEAGYASLWSFQRLLVPEGSGMEPVYRSVLDPMVALGYAAASTSRIRLGVAVINLPFVSPVLLAKQAATVDVLSGGRFDLGLGIGWLPEEFAAAGASTARRGARAEEFLAVLRTLWADEVSSFSGEFYTIPAGRQDPRPVRKPGPPVLLGGMSRPAMERAGRIADGWITSSRADLSKIADAVAVIRAAASAAGRDPDALRIVCRGVVLAGRGGQGPGRRAAAAVGQLRADPRGCRVARRARGDRAVLRPELGSAGRLALGRAAVGGGPGRGDPRRAGSRRGVSFVRPGRPGRPGPRGGRWRRPRYGWPRRACRGCWTRARWPSSAR